jgi:hypothetical protein
MEETGFGDQPNCYCYASGTICGLTLPTDPQLGARDGQGINYRNQSSEEYFDVQTEIFSISTRRLNGPLNAAVIASRRESGRIQKLRA